ncbi:hypothetical protein DF186_20115, partial [Enterococcus hirae]
QHNPNQKTNTTQKPPHKNHPTNHTPNHNQNTIQIQLYLPTLTQPQTHPNYKELILLNQP